MSSPLRLILLIQTIGGGFFGALMTWGFAASQAGHSPIEAIVVVFLFAGFMSAGLSLSLFPHLSWPIVWALAAQILWVSSPMFSYKLGAGFSLWVVIRT